MGLFSRKKTDKTRWICKNCGQELSIKDIGSGVSGDQYTIPPDGNCEDIVSEKDEVLCNKCTMGLLVAMGVQSTKKKGECLTVTQLMSFEENLRSNSLEEAEHKIEKRKKLPDNSVRLDSFRFDNEGKVFFEFTCPKCSKKAIAFVPNLTIKTPEEQLEYYINNMYEKIPMTCRTCNHKFIIHK